MCLNKSFIYRGQYDTNKMVIIAQLTLSFQKLYINIIISKYNSK